MAHGGDSVHVWGSISHMGKTSLCVLDQNVTGALYRRVLDEHLVSHDREWYRNNWILACVVDAYPHEQDIICMNWAPYRPDSNSIKLIWDEIGRGVEELDPQSVNLMQLGVVVQNIWQHIPLERVQRLQTLLNNIPRRVRALVDASRGSSTQY